MNYFRYIVASGLILFLSSPPAMAQLVNPLGKNVTIPILIGRIIKAIMGLSGIVALLMFVWGGWLWMTSRGDSKKVSEGRQTFLFAVFGLVIIFTAYTAVNFVIDALQDTTTPTATPAPAPARR